MAQLNDFMQFHSCQIIFSTLNSNKKFAITFNNLFLSTFLVNHVLPNYHSLMIMSNLKIKPMLFQSQIRHRSKFDSEALPFRLTIQKYSSIGCWAPKQS